MATDVEHFGPFDIQSGKVEATSDSGATADRSQWYTAPTDRFFAEESIHITVISAVGHNTFCSIAQTQRKTITFHNDGRDVPVSVIVAFLVQAHAETGSGVTNIGKTAWIEAKVDADLIKYIP